MRAQIPKHYAPIFTNDYLYFVFYGGRGGGKTENIAQTLVILASSQKLRILCVRESQLSLAESVKSTLEKWIEKLGLGAQFRITNNSIESASGSEFIFQGMRHYNAVNVKSITQINITWIEEAEAFSKRSWQLLVPSVIRVQNPKIIISFNPYKSDDIIYQEFISHTPPARAYICNVNYCDNPFFKNSQLEAQMLNDRERLPASEFAHIWEGKLIEFSDDSLFKNADLSEVAPSPLQAYEKIIIACDPAATNKDHSNEYGIIVAGARDNGIIHILADFSKNMSPLEFATAVQNAAQIFNTPRVVVEVNNGGDFIKALILQIAPNLEVIEVRASSDKIQRAAPVASLMQIGKVRLAAHMPELTRQMRLLTQKGYLGARGESPDRLDALVWAVWYLAELRDLATAWRFFDIANFAPDATYLSKAQKLRADACYAYFNGFEFFAIVFDIYKDLSDYRIRITGAQKFQDFEKIASQNFSYIALNDCENTSHLFVKNALSGYTTQAGEALDKIILEKNHIIKSRKIMLESAPALEKELQNYAPEQKGEFNFLRALFAIIKNEF